jgi:hypothetical protein
MTVINGDNHDNGEDYLPQHPPLPLPPTTMMTINPTRHQGLAFEARLDVGSGGGEVVGPMDLECG